MAMLPRRPCRAGILFDIFLVFVVLVLIMTFTHRGSYLPKTDRSQSDVDREFIDCLPSANIRSRSQRSQDAAAGKDEDLEGDGGGGGEEEEEEDSFGNRSKGGAALQFAKSSVYIDQRLKVIRDSRSKECRRVKYDIKETVTIILHFNDYQLNDLKNTIGSILLYTDMRLVEEIIVVDDASSLDHIVRDAVLYFKLIPKVRYLRNRSSDQAGVAKVRTTAAKEAKTGVLVFLDSWAICSKGWLEPLVDALAKDPNAIVAPHFDRIHDPVSLDYVIERKHQIFSVSWNLAIRGRPSPEVKTSHGYYHSPAVRGNVFAVRKDFFFAVGAYDVGLDSDGGGEQVELSVRAWLCTGSVKVAYCSRVGLLNLYDPVKVSSQRNVRRIAEKWFGAKKSTVYRSFGMAAPKSSGDQTLDLGPDHSTEQQHSNRLIGQCKDIDWFLANIATNMVTPSSDAVQFGILRVKTDRCSRLLPAFDRVKLDDCKQEHFVRHQPEMLFELTAEGHLKVMGKCLTTKDNAYILAEKCRPGDTKQQWRYKNEELVNVWCSFCGMHVTDPDPRMEGDRQILMAQECNSDGSNGGLFKKWEFLLP